MGRQMGIFSYSRALRVAVTTWGVLSFGPAPDLAAGTLLSPGPGQEIRRAIRGVCISPNRRRTAGEMPAYPAQARRGAGATGALRRDLRIVIMRDTIRGEDHAVAAARLDGHWLTLDNRRMAMVEDAYVRNYRPLFVIDQYGVMQYVAPLLAVAPDQEPSAALKLAVEPGLISSSN